MSGVAEVNTDTEDKETGKDDSLESAKKKIKLESTVETVRFFFPQFIEKKYLYFVFF